MLEVSWGERTREALPGVIRHGDKEAPRGFRPGCEAPVGGGEDTVFCGAGVPNHAGDWD